MSVISRWACIVLFIALSQMFVEAVGYGQMPNTVPRILFRDVVLNNLVKSIDNSTSPPRRDEMNFGKALSNGTYLAFSMIGICREGPPAGSLPQLDLAGMLYWIGGPKTEDISCRRGQKRIIGKSTSNTVISGNIIDLTGSLTWAVVNPDGSVIGIRTIATQRAQIRLNEQSCELIYYEVNELEYIRTITRNTSQSTCKYYVLTPQRAVLR